MWNSFQSFEHSFFNAAKPQFMNKNIIKRRESFISSRVSLSKLMDQPLVFTISDLIFGLLMKSSMINVHVQSSETFLYRLYIFAIIQPLFFVNILLSPPNEYTLVEIYK